jgi:hypothetical protein
MRTVLHLVAGWLVGAMAVFGARVATGTVANLTRDGQDWPGALAELTGGGLFVWLLASALTLLAYPLTRAPLIPRWWTCIVLSLLVSIPGLMRSFSYGF